MSLKKCCRCKLEKPVTEFFKHKGEKDGLQYTCKTCSAERQRADRAANPLKFRIKQAMRYYRLSYAEASSLVERAATEPCQICQRITGNLCIDHDHDTHVVRGLLCSPCNTAIGLLQDKTVVVDAAALYLRTHKGHT